MNDEVTKQGARRRRLATLLGIAGLALAVAPGQAAGADTRPEFVVAILGDSYAAGEGTPGVFGQHSVSGELVCVPAPLGPGPCFEEMWWANDSQVTFPQQDEPTWGTETLRCYRSSSAPGPRALEAIQEEFPAVKVVGIDFACTGAKILEGPLGPYLGIEPSLRKAPPIPAQVTDLSHFLGSPLRPLDAVVMNIGGNDAHFADVVARCLFNPFVSCADDTFLRGVIADAVGSGDSPGLIDGRLKRLACALHTEPCVGGTTGDPTHAGPPTPADDANPENFCDSEGPDQIYAGASLRESKFMFDELIVKLNAAFARAVAQHGWIGVTSQFAAYHDHGICAQNTFFRTLGDALLIQGNDLPFDFFDFPIPFSPVFLSSGIAHGNRSGYGTIANAISAKLREQVRMRFTPPALTLGAGSKTGFTLQWIDPSPLFEEEDSWQVEFTQGASVTLQPFVASAITVTQQGVGNRLLSLVIARPPGEYIVRVRGCRPNGWCGVFSNAITVATVVPGTPTGVERLFSLPFDHSIRIGWTPAPSTPARVRYEIRYGRDGIVCQTFVIGGTPTQVCHTGLENVQTAQSTTTSFQLGSILALLATSDTYGFAVRACSDAGCSPFSPLTLIPVDTSRSTSPVGTFGVRNPRSVPAGKNALVQIWWHSPRRWTELDRIDCRLIAGGHPIGLVRFTQDDGVFWLVDGKSPASFGHPEERRILAVRAVSIDLAKSAIVRFGPSSHDVIVRIALAPSRSLRGHALTLRVGARDDRGRSQPARVAGSLVVR